MQNNKYAISVLYLSKTDFTISGGKILHFLLGISMCSNYYFKISVMSSIYNSKYKHIVLCLLA